MYSLGESETRVGNALKGVREEIVVATKVRLPMSTNFNRSGVTRVNICAQGDFADDQSRVVTGLDAAGAAYYCGIHSRR